MKNQRKFAEYEATERTGECEDDDKESFNYEVSRYINLYKDYQSSSHQIATMMFDGYFRDANLKFCRKLYGKKLWQMALEKYATGDHDT